MHLRMYMSIQLHMHICGCISTPIICIYKYRNRSTNALLHVSLCICILACVRYLDICKRGGCRRHIALETATYKPQSWGETAACVHMRTYMHVLHSACIMARVYASYINISVPLSWYIPRHD